VLFIILFFVGPYLNGLGPYLTNVGLMMW